MTGLQDGLKEMEEKKDALPQTSMQEISRQVEILNRGMQGLYQAAGTLSGGLSELGKASDALQNGAAGIQNLQQGFESLGQYNEALKSGADLTGRYNTAFQRAGHFRKPAFLRFCCTFSKQSGAKGRRCHAEKRNAETGIRRCIFENSKRSGTKRH